MNAPRIPRSFPPPGGWRRARLAFAVASAVLVWACADGAGPATGSGPASAGDISGDFKGQLGGQDATKQADGSGSDFDGKASDAPADLLVSDLVTGPADFGQPCTENADCQSGWCVQSPEGKVCTKECKTSCDDGWTCSQVPGGSDTTFICVPKFLHLCQPCATSSECNENGGVDHKCVQQGGEGSFCGAACTKGGNDCPSGYACSDIVDADTGKAAWQCLPTSNKCTCSAVARSRKATTGCVVKNAFGSCSGQRTCGPGGLTPCDAPTPAAEVCDDSDNDCDGKTDNLESKVACNNENEFGVCGGGSQICKDGAPACSAPVPKPEVCNSLDDDCDGKTDEALCDDGNPCTIDTCNSDGSCKNVVPPDASCDDGDACTAKDKCIAGACKGGAALDCDDENVCTADSCDIVKGCVHSNVEATKPCPDDGNPCTFDGCDGLGKCAHTTLSGICTIAGQCVTAGTIDPKDPCKVCNPLQSKTQYVLQNGLQCDDGNACTVADKCTAGTCGGKPMDCSGKDGPCTEGICNAGVCVTAPKVGGCDDGNPCTEADACANGVCQGASKDCSKFDGACTVGTCEGGVCQAKPKPNSCDDGDPCTTGDSCGTGGCKGTPMNCTSLDGPCGKGVCKAGQCVTQPAGSGGTCSDGNPCTVSDTCQNGVCAGVAKDCSYLDDACGKGTCSAGQCVKSGGSGVCTPGESQSQKQPCGNCGTQSQTRLCSTSCQWGAWGAWGSCTGQGVCKPGATESANQGCGNCGLQSHSRTCTSSCSWGAWGNWSTCSGQGVCQPGAKDGNCSDVCAERVCSAACTWGSCGLKSGAQCLFKAGTNYQCCGTKKWQFCAGKNDGGTSACHWYPCQSVANACY